MIMNVLHHCSMNVTYEMCYTSHTLSVCINNAQICEYIELHRLWMHVNITEGAFSMCYVLACMQASHVSIGVVLPINMSNKHQSKSKWHEKNRMNVMKPINPCCIHRTVMWVFLTRNDDLLSRDGVFLSLFCLAISIDRRFCKYFVNSVSTVSSVNDAVSMALHRFDRIVQLCCADYRVISFNYWLMIKDLLNLCGWLVSN